MNCDQVFDILTRGPFPTGTSCDAPVEAHLSVCPECHRLAEALRPAVELFQEAVDPEESRDLPGYWCSVTADAPQGAVSFAREVASRATEPRRLQSAPAASNWSALTAWRMAAMLAVGLTLGTLVSSRLVTDEFRWPAADNVAGAAAAAPRVDSLRARKLSKAELAVIPAACYRRKPVNAPRYTQHTGLLTDARLGELNCCSACHNAASDSVPSAATVKAAQSCQLCHNDTSRLSYRLP
ncbi:MAG: hypothetical protein DWQ37_17820 [Planctomycetota bacterium]|nr:MAG: hypothetical protein DWQ37_17820 [Planctomycetota bacterium]